MAQFGTHVDEDLQLIDVRLKQLRNEYEQYFLGSRKREPQQLRGEVNKMVNYYTNVTIQNTGYRFKFNNLRSRYFSLRRHWDLTCRKIEEGRYERHLFKARIHEQGRDAGAPAQGSVPGQEPGSDLFDSYVAARQATGQGAEGLTKDKLEALLQKQQAQICKQYGVAKVNFRVVVEEGKAKLKATPVR